MPNGGEGESRSVRALFLAFWKMGSGGDPEGMHNGQEISPEEFGSMVTPFLIKEGDDAGETLADVEVPKWSDQITLRGILVFMAIALILGDGLYNFVKVLGATMKAIFYQ